MEKKDVIAQLLKQGAKQVKNLVVKNVTVSPQQEYTRLGITLDKEVNGYRVDENGTYVESFVNVIFVILFHPFHILFYTFFLSFHFYYDDYNLDFYFYYNYHYYVDSYFFFFYDDNNYLL